MSPSRAADRVLTGIATASAVIVRLVPRLSLRKAPAA
jgi:hypothetical protein